MLIYEDLLQEEKNRQTLEAIAVGVAAGANAYSASQAGYYNASGTAYTSRGPVKYTVSAYIPTAAAIAQSNVSATNAVMIERAVETGQRNMAALERQVLKDNTVMPGEWVGGRFTSRRRSTIRTGSSIGSQLWLAPISTRSI